MSVLPNPIQIPEPASCLAGGGEMGALMRSIDWSMTPLGPVEFWSPTLQIMARVLLANRLPMVIWWGPEFCQLYNNAFASALGDKHPRSMGQPASECWAEIWRIIGPLIEKSFRGEAAVTDDLFLEINRHGFVEETHWTIAYSPIPDDTMPNQFSGVLGMMNEITRKVVAERRIPRDLGTRAFGAKTAGEARAAEDALREERFRRYFDLGLIGMAITSPAQGCLEANDELCRILGYERSELLQKNWAEMTHPDDLAADVAQFNRVLAGEIDGYTLDKRWICKNGRVIDSIMAAKCMRRADGSVDYFVRLVLDTTERKQAEAKSRESERRFALLAKSLPHHVWTFRPDGTCGYWNQRLIDYTGRTPEELRQGSWAALHPDDVERVQAAWHEAMAHGTDYEMEERVRGRDGNYRRFLCRAVAVKDEQDRVVEWFGTNTDVEEFRRTEEAVRATQAELAHMTRAVAMGELTSSIAHEINQPLTVVVANANACSRMLAANAPDLREIRAAVQDIAAAGTRAAEVISHIRGLLKNAQLEKSRVDANEIIREVLGITSAELRKHKISLRIELHPDLPPVLGDRVQLRQVVLNLVLNAIDAMAAVDQPRVLCVRSMVSESGVLIAIEDSGPGVNALNAEQIFGTFFTTKQHGMGMGLPISRSIIAAHGGRLWAEPGRAGGTRFQFTLARTA